MKGHQIISELNLESALQLPGPGIMLCSLVPTMGSSSSKWAPSSLVSTSLSPRWSLSPSFQRRAFPELPGWTGALLFTSTPRMFPHRVLRHPKLFVSGFRMVSSLWSPKGALSQADYQKHEISPVLTTAPRVPEQPPPLSIRSRPRPLPAYSSSLGFTMSLFQSVAFDREKVMSIFIVPLLALLCP